MSQTKHRAATPEVSVIIPVYNEEEGLAALFARLYPALDALAATYEVIFINDGSRDKSAALLAEQFRARPDTTRVIMLNGNYGQHMAILAGFEQSRGDIVITLDADLQNPPEEIGKLVAKMHDGYDYVGSIRLQRQDSLHGADLAGIHPAHLACADAYSLSVAGVQDGIRLHVLGHLPGK